MFSIIDIGSNTIIMAIYEVKDGIDIVLVEEEVVGLRNYYNKDSLSKVGINKLIEVLGKYKKLCQLMGIDNIYPFATASLRRAENLEEILVKVKESLGLEIEIISGEDEASYGFKGIQLDYDIEKGYILDIGGGSTELIYVKNSKIDKLKSVDLGTIKLYSSLKKIFPSREEIKEIDKLIDYYYGKYEIEERGLDLYGIAGNNLQVEKLARYIFDIKEDYIAFEYIDRLRSMVDNQDINLLKIVALISPSRLHLLALGIMLTHKAMVILGSDRLYTSTYGIKEGYLKKIISE